MSADATAVLTRFDRPIHAVVQGAAGGIGRELTRQLLDDPTVVRVSALYRRPEGSQSLVELQRDAPGRLEALRLDLSDEDSIKAVAAQLADGPEIDLVINASGFLWNESYQPEKRLGQLEVGALETAFRINAWGPMLVFKHLVPLMPKRSHTVIASLSARVGSIEDNRLGGWYSYRASKAALNMLHRTLAVELARSHPGCACVVLHPGTVDTGLSRPFQSRVKPDALFEPRLAARQLLDVIGSLDSSRTGSFLDWAGTTVPW